MEYETAEKPPPRRSNFLLRLRRLERRRADSSLLLLGAAVSTDGWGMLLTSVASTGLLAIGFVFSSCSRSLWIFDACVNNSPKVGVLRHQVCYPWLPHECSIRFLSATYMSETEVCYVVSSTVHPASLSWAPYPAVPRWVVFAVLEELAFCCSARLTTLTRDSRRSTARARVIASTFYQPFSF